MARSSGHSPPRAPVPSSTSGSKSRSSAWTIASPPQPSVIPLLFRCTVASPLAVRREVEVDMDQESRARYRGALASIGILSLVASVVAWRARAAGG